MKARLLLVEDDDGLRTSLERSLRRRGHEVLTAATVTEGQEILRKSRLDILLLDLRLPDGSGLDLLADTRELDDPPMAVMMTAFPDVKAAVRAMKAGARDFVVKPFELEEVHLILDRIVEELELRRRVLSLEREQTLRSSASEILGRCPEIRMIQEQIRKVAATDAAVLITGQTGTGKELVADAIHRGSARAAGSLIKVNCSAFSEQLLESELFGHVKGAFTDAKTSRPGLFEMADGGTLLLDEVSEMNPILQAKLLRVVEYQAFRRVGGQQLIHTDVRLLASTNRDLSSAIRRGDFRQDLYFRLNVFEIKVPPLHARGDDIHLLACHFLKQFSGALRKKDLTLSPEASETLLSYPWPGNVRELRNVMERAAILCESGVVGVEHLPVEILTTGFVHRQAGDGSRNGPTLRQVEQRYIEEVVQRVDGNVSEAARILGIARNTLKAKLQAQDAAEASASEG